MQLYELAGAEADRLFSPYCWRARMALAHKGLAAASVPVRFSEKHKIAFSGQQLVPVLVDGDKTIPDSWAIACYLEDAYADRPSLFGGEAGRALTRFVASWTLTVLQPAIARIVTLDVWRQLEADGQAYFRDSREKRFGMTLEAFTADADANLRALRQALAPLRTTLEQQRFLFGAAPGYADYVVFGAFQWARCTSPVALLEPADPVHAWRARMLDLFGGLAAQAKGYPPG